MSTIDVSSIFGPAVDISNLELIGNYSLDGDNHYRDDLSQLKYYFEPPSMYNVYYDLKIDNGTVHKDPTKNVKIDFLLKWIADHFDLLINRDATNSKRWLYPEIICSRSVLRKFLMTAIRTNDWIVCASKFKGTIYLCNFDTDEKKIYESSATAYEQACMDWGYKFEQYLLSDDPHRPPNPYLPINHNAELCCIFKSQFGSTSLLYRAEMDGVSDYEAAEGTLAEKTLNFLELKTIHQKAFRQGRIIHTLKTLDYWAQSYLVGVKDIVCGIKNSDGVIQSIRKFKTDEICSQKELKQQCKSFFNTFLQTIKCIVDQEFNECQYKFTYNHRTRKIIVEKMKPDPNSEYTFLHSWYINKANTCFESA